MTGGGAYRGVRSAPGSTRVERCVHPPPPLPHRHRTVWWVLYRGSGDPALGESSSPSPSSSVASSPWGWWRSPGWPGSFATPTSLRRSRARPSPRWTTGTAPPASEETLDLEFPPSTSNIRVASDGFQEPIYQLRFTIDSAELPIVESSLGCDGLLSQATSRPPGSVITEEIEWWRPEEAATFQECAWRGGAGPGVAGVRRPVRRAHQRGVRRGDTPLSEVTRRGVAYPAAMPSDRFTSPPFGDAR